MTPLEDRTVRWIYRKPWYGPILSSVGIRTDTGGCPGLTMVVMRADWRRGTEPGREYFAVGVN
jgi:hypothetical protein